MSDGSDIDFDDNQRPVPSVGFDFDAVDAAGGDAGATVDQLEILAYIIEEPRLHDIGRIALLAAHLTGCSGCTTERQLAGRLGISQPAVHEALSRLRSKLLARAQFKISNPIKPRIGDDATRSDDARRKVAPAATATD